MKVPTLPICLPVVSCTAAAQPVPGSDGHTGMCSFLGEGWSTTGAAMAGENASVNFSVSRPFCCCGVDMMLPFNALLRVYSLCYFRNFSS